MAQERHPRKRTSPRKCRSCRCATWSSTRTWSSPVRRPREVHQGAGQRHGQRQADLWSPRRARTWTTRASRTCIRSGPSPTSCSCSSSRRHGQGAGGGQPAGADRVLRHDRRLLLRQHSPLEERLEADDREQEVLMRSAVTLFDQYVKLNKKVPPEVLTSLSSIDERGGWPTPWRRTCP